MEIKIGYGTENVTFGLLQETVKIICGIPDKISQAESLENITYYYYANMIKLNFDKDEGYKLYSIEIHHPEMKIFDSYVYFNTKEEIEKILIDHGYSDFEHEDYDTFETLFCKDIMVQFKFKFNKLMHAEFSPLFKNDNEIIWPI